MPPTLGSGKICYILIPATDSQQSADFYARTFGWTIRRRGDGTLTFDDGVGEVSGAWITSMAPAVEPGMLIYIMVANVAAAMAAVRANGGEIVQPIGDGPEITAQFRDPAGNVFGLYQERTLAPQHPSTRAPEHLSTRAPEHLSTEPPNTSTVKP